MTLRPLIISLMAILLLIILPSISRADADFKSNAVLDRLAEEKHPEGLDGFSCTAEMDTSVEGEGVASDLLYAIVEMPVVTMDITYYAPFDFRVELDNSPIPGVDEITSNRLRGDDPLTLSNPALKQALLAVYDADYVGEEMYDGATCDVIQFTPHDETAFRPPFKLYIRQSDNTPVYTTMMLKLGDEAIEFRSSIEYTTVDGYQLPSKIETRADFMQDTELVMTTTFYNYKVNPGGAAPSGSGTSTGDNDDEEFSFADIYHGFEDPVMMVDLGPGSDPLTKLRFAFALEVPSNDVAKELEKKHPQIVAAVRDSLDGRRWGDIKDNRYELERELMGIVNGFLEEGQVTDFYFTLFQAER